MTFGTEARRVRDPNLPPGQRYTALRSAVGRYRYLGYEAAWAFITKSERKRRLDVHELLDALRRLETSRHAWLTETADYAARRKALKPLYAPDPEETRYRHGPRWPGPDSEEAVTGAVALAWEQRRKAVLTPRAADHFAPLWNALEPVVDAFLHRDLNALDRQRLIEVVAGIEAARTELRADEFWAGRRHLARVAALIGDHSLPLVRRGWSGDAAAVTAIFRAARGRMTYLPSLYTYDQTAWFVEHIMTARPIWIAEVQGAPVGFAVVWNGWLEHLYVDPGTQSRGIGAALLERAKRGRSELNLRVFEQNTGARAFYARHGFTVVSGSDGAENEERLPDLHLRWRRR